MRPRLFTPGPTQISDEVVHAMAQNMVHHRSSQFKEFFAETSDMLRKFFKTNYDVLTLTSSGSGGMEGAVINFLSRGDKVITIEGGKFGQRWGEIARAYGLEVIPVEIVWGESISPEEFKTVLMQHKDAKAVMFTHSETSTGTAFDIQGIAKVVRENSDAITIIDGVTSVGVLPFFMDEWDLDVVVAGSQKGAMIPPGLAFVAVSERAWQRADSSDLPKYYFNFKKARKSLHGQTTPFTPATMLLIGLNESLKTFLAKGHEHYWQKYAALSYAMRNGLTVAGLEIFSKNPSHALTAVKVPEGVDGQKFVKILRDNYNVTVAGGQEFLKGKIFRVSHMGHYDQLDMMSFVTAMELAFRDIGWALEPGIAAHNVQKFYMEFTEKTAGQG
ncbi:MAG: alanine--glyoxylate aminotransferase family protein [Deferribacteres bacterium]|nr:alanine--glyoxylate aminotransferase family protein [candidate division KSB1 bacterium]MCB9504056.1 alanine--glyoxylate aminotransferase family protein [Deferribacteres bacterium]